MMICQLGWEEIHLIRALKHLASLLLAIEQIDARSGENIR